MRGIVGDFILPEVHGSHVLEINCSTFTFICNLIAKGHKRKATIVICTYLRSR